jgi:hypothetical protein
VRPEAKGRLIPLTLVPCGTPSWPPPKSGATPSAGSGPSASARSPPSSGCPPCTIPTTTGTPSSGPAPRPDRRQHAHRLVLQDALHLRRRPAGGRLHPDPHQCHLLDGRLHVLRRPGPLPRPEAGLLRGPDRLDPLHPRAGRQGLGGEPGLGRRGRHRPRAPLDLLPPPDLRLLLRRRLRPEERSTRSGPTTSPTSPTTPLRLDLAPHQRDRRAQMASPTTSTKYKIVRGNAIKLFGLDFKWPTRRKATRPWICVTPRPRRRSGRTAPVAGRDLPGLPPKPSPSTGPGGAPTTPTGSGCSSTPATPGSTGRSRAAAGAPRRSSSSSSKKSSSGPTPPTSGSTSSASSTPDRPSSPRAPPSSGPAVPAPILRGDEVWCQGFSEPGAGSDLASLRTRAVRDGDDYVVTGSKIWTSHAEVADYCELLVRTGDEDSRHRGITWLACPWTARRRLRPLTTIAGSTEFAELFLDEVACRWPTGWATRTTAGGSPWSPSASNGAPPSSATCSRPSSSCPERWLLAQRTGQHGRRRRPASGRPPARRARRPLGPDQAQRLPGRPHRHPRHRRHVLQTGLHRDPNQVGRVLAVPVGPGRAGRRRLDGTDGRGPVRPRPWSRTGCAASR